MRLRARRSPLTPGFTLIEMLLVVAIISILSALGIWRTRELIPRMNTRHVARDFANDMEMVRMRATSCAPSSHASPSAPSLLSTPPLRRTRR